MFTQPEKEIKSVIICAAGEGSRLGLNIPKSLIEIEGQPIIYWQLEVIKQFPKVIIVIGFKAELLIEAVSKKRSDIIFIYNHDYKNTNTLHSLKLGSSLLNEPFISLDGDLLVNKQAIEKLIKSPFPSIGIKKTYSEEPVCVRLKTTEKGDKVVIDFIRERDKYEWTGLAKIHPKHLFFAKDAKYVFEALKYILPINCIEIDCFEVDTKTDLLGAKQWMSEQISLGNFGKKEAR